VSLVGFGLDSGIEVSAALILAWRLAQDTARAAPRKRPARDPRHRRVVLRPGRPVAGGDAGAGPGQAQGGAGVGANQTSLCAGLSAVLLVGLAANAALGWWWADPAAGLGIAALAAVEGVRTWRAESLPAGRWHRSR
jgi:hypothetical protein